jgi:hypothetical protein
MKSIFGLFLCITTLSGCLNLQSDEELRRDIVGTWEWDQCGFPYDSDFDIEYPFPGGKVVFRSDGRFIQDNFDSNICRDSNGIDSVSISFPFSYCQCSWFIENGMITILSDSSLNYGYFNFPYPLLKLDDDCLVLDEVFYNGRQIEENLCFQRIN